MGCKTAATGAGRTDTGVHALGQGVSFLGGERWDAPASDLRRALNALLPREIWVQQVHVMRPGFDARRSATARRYRYLIGTDEGAASPFRKPYEWALGRALDPSSLESAAAALIGEHDFRGLAAAGANTAHYRCRVALAQWAPRADGVGMAFTVEADRSCITWCGSSWAPWSTSPLAGARRRISPVCLQRPIIWRSVRLPRPRVCTWRRCAIHRTSTPRSLRHEVFPRHGQSQGHQLGDASRADRRHHDQSLAALQAGR